MGPLHSLTSLLLVTIALQVAGCQGTAPSHSTPVAAAARSGSFGHPLPPWDDGRGLGPYHPGGGRLLASATPAAKKISPLQAGNPDRPSFCASLPDLPIVGGGLTGPNLVQNAAATNGTNYWFGFDNCDVIPVPGWGGVNYISTVGRAYTASAPAQLLPGLAPGSYEYVAWVRLSGGDPHVAMTTMKVSDTEYFCVAAVIAKSTCWTKFQGGFTLANASDIILYVEGPPPAQDVLIASMSVTLINPKLWRNAQNSRIYKLRTRPVQVKTVRQVNGRPVQTSLKIDQVQSAFPFGGGMNGAITVDTNFQNWFKSRFNWAVFQNEMKWYYTEYLEGSYNYVDADNMAAYCAVNNISIRGHNVFWEVQDYVPAWVQNLTDLNLYEAMLGRVQSVVGHYKGRVKHWDVDNEVLHANYYESRLGPYIQPWMYNETHFIDPDAKLFLNDYNVVEQCGDPSALPEVYLDRVANLTKEGAEIDGIGCEAHFTDQPNAARIKHDLDMLQQGGIPVWFTELDVTADDFEDQADYLETVMREAFSHPAVQGIVLWQTAHPPCTEWNYFDPRVCGPCANCLVNDDWTERPLGQRYEALRLEWSSHVATKATNRNGLLSTFRGYHGTYRAIITYRGKTFTQHFEVPPGVSLQKITLKVPV